MNSNKNQVFEISIKDVILVSLKKIWIMLIVGAILGGALFYNNIRQEVKTSDALDITKKLSAGESDAQYQIRVQKLQRAKVYYEMINNVNLQIEHEKTYIAESLFMQIDPENIYQANAQISLTVDNANSEGIDTALFAAYEREIKFGNTWDEYAEQIGTKPDYIRELVSFTSSPADNTILSTDNVVSRTGSMYFSVYGPSQEFVDGTINVIINRINEIYADVNSEIAPHTITLIGVQVIEVMDNGIRDGQISHTNRIKDLQGQIESYNVSLDSLAKDLGVSDKTALISFFNNGGVVEFEGIPTETSEKIISRSSMIKPNLQWIWIGLAAGAFLVFCILVLSYIFARKIMSQAQFFGRFAFLEKIGVLKPTGKRFILSSFIDRKTEDDNKMSVENCNKLISANYSNLTKDANKVLITGTADIKAMEETVKNLGLKGDFKPDIFSNPDVLKTVPEYDAIVLIEQRRVSMYKTVKDEIKLLSNGGTEIIGAILI